MHKLSRTHVILGKKVMSVFPKSQEVLIDGSALKPGIYFT